ncbi:hypothetical protein SG34_004560 [Thalassomonas viridans]|uniref:Uncharacterized protein n=1 Tax=Thalassomonas viridans TaxID=137584 RepID=A0AAF0C8A3_9GAMM|nr:hypothetical protein [Thalassomonas viridans]WDE06207.1 hypothetical protein SG34_004560 [Thalassomonas viridans]
MTKKNKKIVSSAAIGLLALSTDIADASDNEIPIRLYGEPNSLADNKSGKVIFTKQKLKLSLTKLNLEDKAALELSALGAMWKDILTNEELQYLFINSPYEMLKDYGLSSDFVAANQQNIDLLKVLLSPEVQTYVRAGDHKNLLIELTNLGVINDSNYESLKNQFKSMIRGNDKLAEKISSSSGALNAEQYLSENPGLQFVLNVAVIVNVAIELNVAVHVNLVVGAAIAVYCAIAEDTLDKIASLDIDLQKEKDITLAVTQSSEKLHMIERERIAVKQMTSFIDAAIELGLLNVTGEERIKLIDSLVQKTFNNEGIGVQIDMPAPPPGCN